MPETIRIQFVEPDNSGVLEKIVKLHRQSIPHGFIVSLGPEFMTLFYQSIAASQSGFVVFAEENNRVSGFLAGSLDTRKIFAHLVTHHFLKIFIPVIGQLFRQSVFKKLLESLLYPGKIQSPDLPTMEIINFCVPPAHQGTGLASCLFESALARFRSSGAEAIKVVVSEEQTRALAFCSKVNAKLIMDIEVHSGQKSHVFRVDLDRSNLD